MLDAAEGGMEVRPASIGGRGQMTNCECRLTNGPGAPSSDSGIRHLAFPSGVGDVFRSWAGNSVGVLFSGKGLDGEARVLPHGHQRIPAAVSNRGATKPAGLSPETPAGGGSFARGQRWLIRHSPLRGMASAARTSGFAALATAKIPRRRTPRNFQIGSREDEAEESLRTATIVFRFCKMGCRHCLLGGEPELGLEADGGGGLGGGGGGFGAGHDFRISPWEPIESRQQGRRGQGLFKKLRDES